jgi:tetratricopeptide (TPR) repeat protein
MAKLFLSYSRKDSAKAQRLCEWLEREGHGVWRDEDDIGGGASFSAEIEKALIDCDAVIVLWSESSVQSAWVRDEAGFGRDAGKLVPLTLDGTGPPLGFRQYQSIDLSKWKGHGVPPVADRIGAAIARVAGAQPSIPANSQLRPKSRPRLVLGIGLTAVMLAATALVLFLWLSSSGARSITIAVAASPTSPDRATATDYANVAAADMAAFLPKHFDRATVIAPAEATGPVSGYRMLISTDVHGVAANATLTLSDEDGRTTLWSNNWTVADASAADLKADISASASKAAFCLMQARGGSRRLSQPALGIYLNGCTGVGATKLSNTEFEGMFERITKLVPDFGPAWDYLALSRSWIAESLQDSSPAAHDAAVQSTRAAIAVARKLNPNSAMSYDAEYHLIHSDHFRGLQLLEKASQIDPGDGRIQMHLSDELMSVGRMSDAVQAAQRGVQLEPTTPYTRSQYIQTLFYAGEFSKAKADLAAARKKWPDDPIIDSAEFAFQYRYGDPRVALALLPKITDLSDAGMAPYRKMIAARLDPTRAKVDEAIAALAAGWANNPRNRNPVLIALGNFGRVEEAYQLLEDSTFQPFVQSDVLFRPEFAAVRADPRFIQVAARLGLVRYWRKTGFWPDFCTSEQLKYDCKAEAAKFA